jgi:hypothetical protein
MNLRKQFAGTFFLGIISLSLQAQNFNLGENERLNTITTAVPFLMIAPDSRSGALGDAGVSISPDANAMYWNAAKLAMSKKEMGFAISYIPWLRALVPDINLSYLSGYKKIGDRQAVGVSLFYSSLGNITFTDEQGLTVGQFRPNEFAITTGYSTKLSEYFSGGLTVKYIYSNLTFGQVVQGAQTKPGQSVASDVSMFYQNKDLELGKTNAEIRVGLAINNLGAKMSYSQTNKKDFIPTNLRLGTTFTLKPDDANTINFTVEATKLLVPTPPIYSPFNRDSILVGMDPNVSVANGVIQSFYDAPGVKNGDGTYNKSKEEFREINPSVGIEYWYDNQFALRAGYFYEHPTKGNRQFFTLGAGLKYSVFGLDLTYLIAVQQRNPLANTLRFTLHFDFDSFKDQNKNN